MCLATDASLTADPGVASSIPYFRGDSGFALPIAIAAKCEEIINLAQKIVIWRQLLAKEKSLAKIFVWRRKVTSGLSHCLMPLYVNCQLPPRLTPKNSVADRVNLDTHCF